MLSKPKVLILSDWFEPGYLAGGPIRSVSNLLALCKHEIDFSVFTSDRDFSSDTPYDGIELDKWLDKDRYRIIYTSPQSRGSVLTDILEQEDFDRFYFNSFFSKDFTVKPLMVLRKARCLDRVVVAPRGMLGEGALSLKSTKKRLFIALFKLFRMDKRIVFHSTASSESDSIKGVFNGARIAEIGNVPQIPDRVIKTGDPIKRLFVFTSRISPKKNLHFLLSSWNAINLTSELKVFGTQEDPMYLEQCRELAEGNASIQLNDAIPPNEIQSLLEEADFFVLPTLNENFGHSIIEALLKGCPVIISDQTPWNDLEEYGAGWVIQLDQFDQWRRVLVEASEMDKERYSEMSKRAQEYVRQKFDFDDLRRQYLKLFQTGN